MCIVAVKVGSGRKSEFENNLEREKTLQSAVKGAASLIHIISELFSSLRPLTKTQVLFFLYYFLTRTTHTTFQHADFPRFSTNKSLGGTLYQPRSTTSRGFASEPTASRCECDQRRPRRQREKASKPRTIALRTR